MNRHHLYFVNNNFNNFIIWEWLLEGDSRNIRKRNKNILHLVFILLLKMHSFWLLLFVTEIRIPTTVRSCLYEKNHHTQVRRLTWVRSWQNGIFRFVKTNRLYENWFFPLRWDLINVDEISLRRDDFSPYKKFLPGCPT